MSDPDINKTLIDQLDLNGPTERQKLWKLFKETKGTKGSSPSAFKRTLAQLRKHKKIRPLFDPELEEYGLEPSDGRYTYYISAFVDGLKDHLKEVFKLVNAKNPDTQRFALFEIMMHEKTYVLSPKQLDKLIKVLSSPDRENADRALIIINQYAKEDRLPFSIETFRKTLQEQLKVASTPINQEQPRKHNNYLDKIIYLLGRLNDPAILKEVKKDIQTPIDYTELQRIYGNEGTADVIDKHRKELFDLEMKLAKTGKTERAHRLHQIRLIARKELTDRKEGNTATQGQETIF